MSDSTILTKKVTADAVTRLVESIERRWQASERYLACTGENHESEREAEQEAEESYYEVENALADLAAIQDDAGTRILSILQDHDPRRRHVLDQAVEQLISPATPRS